jgi:hypothetical protein
VADSGPHILRYAEPADITAVSEFIRDHWKSDHIFARDLGFFRYEHLCGESFNFAVAVGRTSGRLDGIVGFIKYTEDYQDSDIFGVMWKARENCGDPFLGVKLLLFLKDDRRFRSFSGCGINTKTIPIYQYLGVRTDRLRQYYMLNDRLSEFKIALVRERFSPRPPGSKARLRRLATMDSVDMRRDRRPYKDAWYLRWRYLEHPIYRYGVFGIDAGGGGRSILVTREIAANGAKILRIVDFIGTDADLEGVGGALRKLMHEHGYEYIDFYEFGVPDAVMESAGFILRRKDDANIIPNYFEPFVQKNIDIHFFTTQPEPFCMFKGDGDQDRPS